MGEAVLLPLEETNFSSVRKSKAVLHTLQNVVELVQALFTTPGVARQKAFPTITVALWP